MHAPKCQTCWSALLWQFRFWQQLYVRNGANQNDWTRDICSLLTDFKLAHRRRIATEWNILAYGGKRILHRPLSHVIDVPHIIPNRHSKNVNFEIAKPFFSSVIWHNSRFSVNQNFVVPMSTPGIFRCWQQRQQTMYAVQVVVVGHVHHTLDPMRGRSSHQHTSFAASDDTSWQLVGKILVTFWGKAWTLLITFHCAVRYHIVSSFCVRVSYNFNSHVPNHSWKKKWHHGRHVESIQSRVFRWSIHCIICKSTHTMQSVQLVLQVAFK